MDNSGKVTISISGAIGRINFYHPKGNSLPSTLLRQITEAIISLDANNDVKVITLTSEGERTFCGGASFDELLEITDYKSARKFFMGFANLILAIKSARKFVVAKVSGRAVGGGVGLIAACDYSVATSSSSVKLSELALGIGPFVISDVVERKIGKSAFTAMTIDTEWRSAEWALGKGLFSHLAGTDIQAEDVIENLTNKLAGFSSHAITKIKSHFWKDTGHYETKLEEYAEQSAELVLTDYTKDLLRKFKEN